MTRFVVATIAVAALAGLLFKLNRIDDIALDVAASPDKLPRYTLTQADLTRYDAAGQPSMKATAATLEYFDDESATATTLVVDVLSGPKTPWHIEAPAGNLRAGSREIELTGEVVAHTDWNDLEKQHGAPYYHIHVSLHALCARTGTPRGGSEG